VADNFTPIDETPATMAIATKAAITAYSKKVLPPSCATKRRKILSNQASRSKAQDFP
jgi:hypothetical protein